MKSRKRNRKQKKSYNLRITGVIWAWTIMCMLFVTNEYYPFRSLWESLFPIHYKHFDQYGIKLPTQYSVHGIDVSHHQGKINWEMASKMKVENISLQFVFIKATEGVTFVDKRFKENWKESKKYQFKRGAYHYFNPNQKGELQASHFINQVELLKGDLPPVIDVEELGDVSPQRLMEGLLQCAKKLEHHFGVKPIIYTFHNFYKTNFDTTFNKYPLWIAHYYQKEPSNKVWKIWQHNDRGRVSGINYPVDFNTFRNDSIQFQQLLLKY